MSGRRLDFGEMLAIDMRDAVTPLPSRAARGGGGISGERQHLGQFPTASTKSSPQASLRSSKMSVCRLTALRRPCHIMQQTACVLSGRNVLDRNRISRLCLYGG